MRLNEFDKPLKEAMPMGGLQKLGQTVRAKLPGSLGAAQASGKLEAGQLANELAKGYYQFLGQLGEKPTPGNLLQYLTKAGYPTKMAIADLKKNVIAPATAPGTALKEKAPNASGSLGLVPKELELEPQEPVTPRKDVTNVPITSAPTTSTPATKPTSPAKPGSIALVPIKQKQIFSALTAAAKETFAGSTATASNSVPTTSATTSTAPSAGPSLAKSFAAGLTGKAPPTSGATTPRQINFQDPKSLNNLVSQINSFAKAGGKLDPTVKASLQKIINAL